MIERSIAGTGAALAELVQELKETIERFFSAGRVVSNSTCPAASHTPAKALVEVIVDPENWTTD
jgi:hypothetical protein